jgi:hypothetical protein
VTVETRLRRARKALLILFATAALALAGLLASGGAASTAQAATQGPCDIYASGGTPCVAAHSTTRALYAAYSGPLYQVRRSSDSATTSISPLSAGGVANAAAQDSFCAGTTCVITEIFDQSGNGNNLTDAPAGGAAGGPDALANAAAKITVGGHEAYGVFIAAGDGYRDDATHNIATGNNSEGEYAIFDGTHTNNGCCFDYGNAETNNDDDGAGAMEAVYFGTERSWGTGSGNGPWIMADMENGLFSGQGAGLNSADPTTNFRFTTAMIEGGANQWAILGGNAQSGSLATDFNGVRPAGYNPMKKQGAIILGIGGDNSKGSAGTFYEGVMTSGYPSATTEAAVQANIVAAGYSASTTVTTGPTGVIKSGVNSTDCVDNNNASGTNGNKVQIWTCDGNTGAQNWTLNTNGTITIDGGCLDITGAVYTNGTNIEWWTCNSGANQQWTAESNGTIVNPTSGKCLDDPASNVTNGTQLDLWTCNGGANQKWTVP